ncbi:MAG: SPFH domain-containing protein [Chloroflexi bacterium]|nr:SPFH domain-containing protein [Chloroflexota bacterium]MCI0579088.1 SPFH domain-containing protein [Chloroflexota bacterium]MCI0650090.1 SPFH domain-containing protein [Chloroflexota bacterium]MCI0728284.1 SPFH domain-containing protein [Chloroflexota bacterium]
MARNVLVIIGLLAVTIIVGAIFGGWQGVGVVLVASLGVAIAGFLVWYVDHHIFIRVPEMDVAVVFNRETRAFHKFLRPGRHWLLPPFLYMVKDMIYTGAHAIEGTTTGARTADGIPVTVNWNMTFGIDPFSVEGDMVPKMARALPKGAEGMARNHGNNVLQHIIGQFTIDQLCDEEIQQRLENRFKKAAHDRISIMGMQVLRVMILSIKLPQDLQAAIEAVKKRELLVSSESRVLKLLQEAIHEFSDRDMERLAELERLRLISQNGVAGEGGLAYLLASLLHTRTVLPEDVIGKQQPD